MNDLYRGVLTALDDKPITPRTGKNQCEVQFNRLPKHGDYIPFCYVNEDCESPGVMIATDNVTSDRHTYRFEDNEGRLFELIIISEGQSA